MPRYTDDSKERARDAVDMVALVSARTELRRAGANRFTGLCPFHEERTPSFGIDPVKKVYHCFGCGASGDVFSFVMETEGADFTGALELVADRAGVTLEPVVDDPQAEARRRTRDRLMELLDRAAGFYERFFWESPEAAAARDYLAGRGLSEEVLRQFRVGYAPSAWDKLFTRSRSAGFSDEELHGAGLAQRSRQRDAIYDRFRARIMFPLADRRGRVVGFGARALRDNQPPKYLNSPDGPVYHKGRQLFGLHLARAAAAKEGAAIVVEGYTDVLALHQAGLPNTVGLMGTALTEDQISELSQLAPRIELALDADAAGEEAMVRAAALARGRRLELRVVPLEPGADPADIVARDGTDEIARRVRESVPFARFRVTRILELAQLDSGDGRDRALAGVRSALAAQPEGVEREELVRQVASRLGLSEKLMASLVLDVPGAGRGVGSGGARRTPAGPAPGGSEPRLALDSHERTERTFLALCIALPEAARDALRKLSLDEHFTNATARRAAAHLGKHLTAPLEGLPPDDDELAKLMAELTVRAGREPADPATLEVQLQQLELNRLDRRVAAARAAGSADVDEHATARSTVKDRFNDAMDRAMDVVPTPPQE
ncbi:MAG TPA: DNA primase [Solirubrobacteraceae bacterium]|nr:DNA primase [Solirubrobacteraceae bacterium]